jgi:hypothetical protein
MFALMFDPRFKSLKVVENYVGCGTCIYLVAKYYANAIIPFLMTMFETLNLTIQACAIEVVGFVAKFGDSIEEENNIFVWVHLWKCHHMHLLLGSCPCSRGYLYPLLHLLIP